MLVGDSPENQAGIRTLSGQDAEIGRAQLLAAAAKVASDKAKSLLSSGWKDDWIPLLAGLAELTALEATAGDPRPRFSSDRLREAAATLAGDRSAWWRDSGETGRKKLTNAWKELVRAVPTQIESSLRGRAQHAGVAGMIAPISEDQGRANGYGLEVVPIALAESAAKLVDRVATETGVTARSIEVEYEVEREIYPIPWIRRPLHISLTGSRRLILVIPGLLMLLVLLLAGSAALFVLAGNLPLRDILSFEVSLATIAGAVAWMLYPGWRLLNDRIVMAPLLVEFFLPVGQQLVLKREGEDTMVLQMVRHVAVCPICKGQVEVDEGRFVNRGRLVGKCRANPVEHQFSFDFITLRGGPIR